MRIIFMGSGELACPALEMLLSRDNDEVVAVVSQPDRPKGRNRRVAPCPFKKYALEHGIPALTPEKVGSADSVDEIEQLKPDVIIVAAYGQYISSKILNLPPYGAINIHPSLLPRYRGASPIQWMLANGETETGTTILYVAKEMDAGDIICQKKIPVLLDDTTASIKPRLAELGAKLLSEALDQIRDGTVQRHPQNEELATYVSKLTKEDGQVNWSMSAEQIRNRVRGFSPWPGCFCESPAGSGASLKLLEVAVEEGESSPGRILEVGGGGPLVGTGEGALRLLRVQPAGRQAMSGQAYLNGHHLIPGDLLG
ncbi:MAG: methionyl-tRNA formyltransferase [Verrucomicrobia bacterium]|nr:methionyl-tRNA formyltransferase [Verrucomicrobiota bacterium]